VRYYVRVALGLALGALAVAALAFLGVRWWIGAIAGALLALAGFLGSFFLWSADRPEEGYEQVLFDGRNNVHALLLVALLAGAAFGGAHLHRGASAPPDPALATMNKDHDRMVEIYNGVTSPTSPLDKAATDKAKADLAAIQTDLGNLTASANQKLLVTAAKAEAAALDAYAGCGYKPCQAAQIAGLLDAHQALNGYAA
jgi:thiol:disulfide interchange protein